MGAVKYDKAERAASVRKWRADNREHYLNYYRNYRKTHPQKRLNDRNWIRKWRKENPEANLERTRLSSYKWRKQNPEGWRAICRRHREKPNARIAHNLGTRIGQVLRRKHKIHRAEKAGSTRTLLGCSYQEFRAHLESMFVDGMTWENYGKVWHIDHIIPCSCFDLLQPEEQMKCFNWRNLQPMFALENIKKGGTNRKKWR